MIYKIVDKKTASSMSNVVIANAMIASETVKIKIQYKSLDSMRWLSYRHRTGGRQLAHASTVPEKMSHFFVFFVPGDLDLWPLTPKFEVVRDFCTAHLTAKFNHRTFNRSEFIVLTNKQIDKQTDNIHLARHAVQVNLLTTPIQNALFDFYGRSA